MAGDVDRQICRYTSQYPRAAWVMDGRLSWPLLLLVMPFVPWFWKFVFIGLAILLSGVLRMLSLPVPMALRRSKSLFKGSQRTARRPARKFTR